MGCGSFSFTVFDTHSGHGQPDTFVFGSRGHGGLVGRVGDSMTVLYDSVWNLL